MSIDIKSNDIYIPYLAICKLFRYLGRFYKFTVKSHLVFTKILKF